jgi:uncharacterized membrane protein (UPF0127 family)
MKLWRLVLAVGLFFGGILPSLAGGQVSLDIETKDGRHLAYKVELAQTPNELAHGLMNRSSVPENTGMLFDFGYERPISMWMKDTPIPLDMLFVTDDGKIVHIAQRTVPMSLETIPSPGPIRAVLEVAGGATERQNIHEGDRLVGAFFKP